MYHYRNISHVRGFGLQVGKREWHWIIGCGRLDKLLIILTILDFRLVFQRIYLISTWNKLFHFFFIIIIFFRENHEILIEFLYESNISG